jgi:SAM-dependent methyltransferase
VEARHALRRAVARELLHRASSAFGLEARLGLTREPALGARDDVTAVDLMEAIERQVATMAAEYSARWSGLQEPAAIAPLRWRPAAVSAERDRGDRLNVLLRAADLAPIEDGPWREVLGAALGDRGLHELQTGGGLALDDAGSEPPSAQEIESAARRRRAIDTALQVTMSHFASAPARLAQALGRPGLRVLDVGAGEAPWSIALAARDPDTRVTAVDLPGRIPVVAEAVRRAAVAAQFEVVGADAFDPAVQLDRHDVVIVANVCHLFDERENRDLLGRAVTWLRPDGVLAMVDQVLEEDPDWDRWSALYAIGVLHHAPGGELYPVSTYHRWFTDLGLTAVSSAEVCPLPPLTVVTGRRPA